MPPDTPRKFATLNGDTTDRSKTADKTGQYYW
jgi:hypothetical protein